MAVVGCAVAPDTAGTETATSEIAKGAPAHATLVKCSEVGGKAAITFLAERGNPEIVKALYRPAGAKKAIDLNVCTTHPPPGPPFFGDESYLSVSCNDVSWVDGVAVGLYEGGMGAAPTVKLSKMNGSGPLVEVDTKFECEYVADPNADLPSGAACHADDVCGDGLKCCYPCGIQGCINRCMAPMSSGPFAGSCPMFP